MTKMSKKISQRKLKKRAKCDAVIRKVNADREADLKRRETKHRQRVKYAAKGMFDIYEECRGRAKGYATIDKLVELADDYQDHEQYVNFWFLEKKLYNGVEYHMITVCGSENDKTVKVQCEPHSALIHHYEKELDYVELKSEIELLNDITANPEKFGYVKVVSPY